MQLESLRVELRPRSPWEAVELGAALVRHNAAAIWKPWLLLTLPVFVLVDVAALALDRIWLAWLLMWWLKPLFDRIPLFVVSRAVFGDTPTTWQTLAAQRSWGWRAMRQHLTWRRIGLGRALNLPIDLLEEADPARLRERRRVLGNAVRGHTALLTVTCVLFIVALSLSALSLGLLFVPWEFLSESARATWSLLTVQPPAWAQVLLHAVVWGATSVIEPFYIGAGFGLYLNRRTQIEAWDVEIALRRMRTRLASATAVMLLVVGVAFLMLPRPSLAQAARPAAQDQQPGFERQRPPAPNRADVTADTPVGEVSGHRANATALDEVFGDARIDDPAFDKAVERAYRDPLLRPKRKQMQWQLRDKTSRPLPSASPFPWLVAALGFISEFGLWLLLITLLVVLAMTANRWWPWLRSSVRMPPGETAVQIADASLPDVMPGDIADAARRLWREGRPRRALALLYRASVEAMTARADVVLVPGATESECLRASRRMPDAGDREVFAHIVRTWQYAAYAQRLPADGEFESLLGDLSRRFGWTLQAVP
ncbi:MAG: DUF4129 domain-containing protein [Luteimonas sp.]